MPTSNMLYQILAAPNDSNGNPRRVTLVINPENGDVVKVLDHGYQGSQIPIGGIRLPTIDIAASVYKDWIRCGKEIDFCSRR